MPQPEMWHSVPAVAQVVGKGRGWTLVVSRTGVPSRRSRRSLSWFPRTSVAGVGHREATASDLFCPVQFAQAVFPRRTSTCYGGTAGDGGLSRCSQPPAPLCRSAPCWLFSRSFVPLPSLALSLPISRSPFTLPSLLLSICPVCPLQAPVSLSDSDPLSW